MTEQKWTMRSGGIAMSDPGVVPRFLCKHYLVIESKANKDELVEFCHLVVLLDFKNKPAPQELEALINGVMNDPEAGRVEEAVRRLNEYADSLPSDPRKDSSSKVAAAWRETKKLRDGRATYKLDDKPISQGSSLKGEFKAKIPIKVKVWSQTQGKLDIPYSEIRCAVPDLAMIGDIHNIIRYAATSFNFLYVGGQRQSKSKKLDVTTQAILYAGSPAPEWSMIEKSRKLATVKGTDSLQLVNTKLKTAAVAVVVRARRALSEPFIFDIEKPLKLVETFKVIMGRREIVESIDQAQDTFIRTRFLSITSVGTDVPFVMPQPHPTGVVDAQSSEAIENSPNDTHSPESHYSNAREKIRPSATSQVHRDPAGRITGRPPQVPPTNSTPIAPNPGASSTAGVESSVTPTPSPENPQVADSTGLKQAKPVSFVKRVLRKIGW